MSSEVKHVDCWKCGAICLLSEIGDADGQCPRCDAEIDLAGYLQEAWKDYAALEAENARLIEAYDKALRRAGIAEENNAALTAQLAAIQGGMGEVVGFDRNAAYAACPESGCDWGSFYVGWKAAASQHQRITAAMAAEVERLRDDEKTMCDALDRLEKPEAVFINMKRGIIAKPSLRSIVELYAGEVLNGEDALQAEILRLRAELSELAEVKGREVAAVEGVTVERDMMGTMHIKIGDFDFIQIQYQYPYTDNASTKALAERIASLLTTPAIVRAAAEIGANMQS